MTHTTNSVSAKDVGTAGGATGASAPAMLKSWSEVIFSPHNNMPSLSADYTQVCTAGELTRRTQNAPKLLASLQLSSALLPWEQPSQEPCLGSVLRTPSSPRPSSVDFVPTPVWSTLCTVCVCRYSESHWWTRERIGDYLPILSLDEPSFIDYAQIAGVHLEVSMKINRWTSL